MDSLPITDDFLHAETLTEKAYRALEEDIVTLRIPPGTVVSEAILSRRLGVGRTPVREALQRLAREWLVVIMPRRGIVVSAIDPVRQLRVLEARREIERFLSRSAAKRATKFQRTQFREIAAGMDEAARQRAGIGAGLLRVSVGIEAPEDLVADLSAGLARALACTPVRAASATAAQVA